jgi:cellulose biosynthesis protein BcsQ
MNAMALDDVSGRQQARSHAVRPVTLAVLHPKGGVGRSTTVWQLGVELALRGRHVRIEDRDQARHLSRMLAQLPPVSGLRVAGAAEPGELLLVDTAPEGSPERTLPLLRESDWVIAPAKPEPASVQALPLLLRWLAQAQHARLLGVLPTMVMRRRASTDVWLAELERLARSAGGRLLPAIPNTAALAEWRLDGHPYAPVAAQVLELLDGQA